MLKPPLLDVYQVLQSKPENLVDTFLLLMPSHAQGVQEFVHVCEMKVRLTVASRIRVLASAWFLFH